MACRCDSGESMLLMSPHCCRSRSYGFTVIELLVVLAALALLLSIAAPRYIQHLDHAREVALKEDLHQMRMAIDHFYADRGRYPSSLEELATQRYLRALPIDPLTDSTTTWVTSPPPNQTGAVPTSDDAATNQVADQGAGVADVHSGASGQASDGSSYASW